MVKLKTAYQILGSFIGLATLCLQFFLTISNSAESGLTYFQGIIKFFSYMTILTNMLVAMAYLVPLLFPDSGFGIFFSKPAVQSAILVYILIVGAAYHFLLAKQWYPEGLWLLADNLLHYVVPVLYLIYWIIFSDKGNQKAINCIRWLCYPLVYIIYILIRGDIGGIYPYYFLNVSKLGFETVLKNIFFLMIAYIVMGLIIIYFDKLLFKISNKKLKTDSDL